MYVQIHTMHIYIYVYTVRAYIIKNIPPHRSRTAGPTQPKAEIL